MSTPVEKQRPTPKTSAERMREHRRRMRERGYRQVQIWAPDSRSPDVIERARRQSAHISATDPDEAELLNWLEGMQDWPED